jgi:uncharacterized protein (TIGR03437 family)
VSRTWLVLAVLCAGTARGAAPFYSADSIVNASNFQNKAGPFAPNSVVSIFGTGLARSTQALGSSDIRDGKVPLELNYVRVYVQDQPAPVLFVSDKQINFIIPSVQNPQAVRVRVTVESVTGPEITVTVVDAAPALFPMAGGYVIAQDAHGKLVDAGNPGHENEVVVVYVTGLGQTSPNPPLAVIPQTVAPMVSLPSLKVTLNGILLEPVRIKYAGVTPGCAGLYQINLEIPYGVGPDPEIVVSAGTVPAQTGLKLLVRGLR